MRSRRCSELVTNRAFLFLNLVFVTIVLTLSCAVVLKLPVIRIVWISLIFAIVLCTCLIGRLRNVRFGWRSLAIVATLLIALGLVVGNPVCKHYFLSTYPDTWSYCALAEYVDHNARGTDEGLVPVEQYAVHLKDTRFGTAALLGLLSELIHGNSATALPLFAIIVLASIFSGFVVLTRIYRCSAICAIAAGFFATACSWIPDVLAVGNLDNLLFLGILPFFLARFCLFVTAQKSLRSILAFAITTSALFYVYPEGLVIAGAIFSPYIACRTVNDLRIRREFSSYALFAALVLGITAPYLGIFFRFVLNQFQSFGPIRPGEGFFSGLFSPEFLPALFGLGKELRGGTLLLAEAILPILFLLLIVVALIHWWRTRRSLVLCFVCLVLLGFWQGGLNHYAYGLYKIILSGTVLWIPAIFLGLSRLIRNFPSGPNPAFQLAALLPLLLATLWQKGEEGRLPIGKRVPMAPFERISQIGSLVGPEGVLIECESDFTQEWAIFFLRSIPVAIGTLRGYMAQPHVVPFMKRAKYAQGEPRWVLTDQRSPFAVWNDDYFYLVCRKSFISTQVVAGPGGIDEVNGKPFIWIGNLPTIFSLNSPKQQTVRFYAKEGRLGPSLPDLNTRTMTVKIGTYQKTFVTNGNFSIDLPVQKGRNLVDLWCQDKPTVTKLPNGETRTLLLGLPDFGFEPQE